MTKICPDFTSLCILSKTKTYMFTKLKLNFLTKHGVLSNIISNIKTLRPVYF